MTVKKKSIVIAAISLAVGITVAVAAAMIPFGRECDEIRKSVFRLHIIANSDSESDQSLKLTVRDAILGITDEIFGGAKSESEASAAARKCLPLLEKTARDTLAANGCDMPVSVTVGDAWFSTREYDGFTLPAGEYEALRVVIGEGKGKNWWCVMFPAVCVPAATGKIEDALDGDGAEIVTEPEKYRFAFFIVELWEKLTESLK